MKKFLLAIMIWGIIGCSKSFTDLNPLSQRNVNSFYKTGNDMVSAINACYKALAGNGMFNQSNWVMMEMRSDNTDPGPDLTGLGADLNAIDLFREDPATATIITTAYLDSYVGIARCNLVLDNIDNVPMDATLQKRIKGEALFLRALFYYNLSVQFGNIPLILKSVTSDEGKKIPQSNASQIYPQLIKDLTQAEDLLLKKQDLATADKGRATKGAAAALLAKVYLTSGDKANAIPVLKRIISDYGYVLLDDYNNLWGINNKNNSESIFEVQYKGGGTNTGNAFTNAFSPLLIQSTGAYKNRPTQNMIDAYEKGDKRFTASMDTKYTSTNGNLVIAAFITKYGRTTAYNEGDADYNFPVFRYADVLLMLAEALGESSQSYELINKVRARAGLSPISSSTTGTFEDKLLHERRVEFAFENQRWPDLLRFNRAKTIMEGLGFSPRLLFRIPQRELDINNSYVQNTQ